jgi:hypothetical protein
MTCRKNFTYKGIEAVWLEIEGKKWVVEHSQGRSVSRRFVEPAFGLVGQLGERRVGVEGDDADLREI